MCALHNYIRRNKDDIDEFTESITLENDIDLDAEWEAEENEGLGIGYPDAAERRMASNRRDMIAEAMWADYLEVRTAQGLPLPQ